MPRIDRRRVVSVRLSRAEHSTAQAQAAAAGTPLGAWLRLRMLDSQDSRERLAALEARLASIESSVASQTEAVASLERGLKASFRSLAGMLGGHPAAAPRPAATAAPTPRT